jgi:hypothetical protein
MVESQIVIKNWFDKTYKNRGFSYLRPLEAYEIFKTILALKPNSKHLDVACGLGLMLKAMEGREIKLHGVDISTEAVIQSRQFCPDAIIQEANAEQLPYQDETFDSLTCLGSLERMIDRKAALQEQYRVSKSGADICLMVRNSENFTWKYIWKPLGLYNKKGHQDALNLEQWKNLFNEAGFEVQKVYPDHWPWFRLLKTVTPWRKLNTGRILKFPFKLELAYEFIFHLKKP